jgi:hypothetical protein
MPKVPWEIEKGIMIRMYETVLPTVWYQYINSAVCLLNSRGVTVYRSRAALA